MAAQVGQDEEIISSINITPLVDIFLVLLIIFMITSSVIDQREIALNAPKAANAGSQAPKAAGLIVDKDGLTYLDGERLDTAAIAAILRSKVADDPEYQVLIGADRDLKYQSVVDVIDLVRGAGVSKYALKVVRP
jgi:biopolymer transport protein ExbD